MATRRTPAKPRLKHMVCKPCWELRYCPYGPLVEYFPLNPEGQSLSSIRRLHSAVRAEFRAGGFRRDHDILEAIEAFLYSYLPRWEWILQFRTQELGCNVFGHVCPVFFMAEPFTETREARRIGRSIPRDIMLKVIRRDGQICQVCNTPVRDTEVEFDHLIPFTHGGPISAENLRLVCRPCNRKRRDSLKEILGESPAAQT